MIRARDLELTAGRVTHPGRARDVAGVVERDHPVVVGFPVQRQRPALDQVPGQLADVHRLPVTRVELPLEHPRERVAAAGADAGERVPVAVGHAPGVSALADHDALHTEVERGLADAQCDLLQLVVVADEQAEVAGFRGSDDSVQEMPAAWKTLA